MAELKTVTVPVKVILSVTGSVADDLRHLLKWLAIVLLVAAIVDAAHVARDIGAHDWIGAGIEALFTLMFLLWGIGTMRRRSKYAPNPARAVCRDETTTSQEASA